MDEYGVYDVCDVFGLRSGSPHGGSRGLNISISCPLAPIKHNDPYDWNLSCSVQITESEPSLARCFSFNCGYKGSFYNMLKQAVEGRKNPPNLVALLKKIEPTEKFTLESSVARSKKRFDEMLEVSRRPRLPEKEQDVIPEGRIERFQSSIPKYAITRGLTKETCKAWGLGYDKTNKRLIFPIRRHDGKLVGLSGRILPSAERRAKEEGRNVTKYHNYAGLDKTRYLFGEHMLEEGKPIIICEGQIDAILTWQWLQIPTVAVLGEGFSGRHVRTISAFNPPVLYIFPDNDPPGHMAAEKIEYAMHGRLPMRLMLPPAGMDPGELTEEEAQSALKNSVPILNRIEWD